MKSLTHDEAVILRKYRILQANSIGFDVYVENRRMHKDLDPERAANKKLASALQAAGVSVSNLSGQTAYDLAESDLDFAATNLILPIGFEENRNVAVVSAVHDENIPTAVLTEYGFDTHALGDETSMAVFVELWAELQVTKRKAQE